MIGKNNVLNIRASKSFSWAGQNGATRGFCDFEGIEMCRRAGLYLLMRSYRRAGVVKLAEVTGQSAQVVSDQMTAIWNNFDDGTKAIEYYADAITALGAATASSSEEIATGMQQFAAIGKTVGLSYEYAASALATITSTSRESADVVGTAFKTIFARIQGLSLGETLEDGTNLNKYSEALQKVGISIFE